MRFEHLNLKEKLETGDILLVDTKGFLPTAIDLFQGSKGNHLAVCINPGRSDSLLVSEAIGRGVTIRNFEHYLNNSKRKYKTIDIYRYIYNRRTLKTTVRNLSFRHAGITKYDFLNLLFFQVVRFTWYKLFKKKLWIGTGETKGEKRFICGEWGAYLYNKALGIFEKWWQDAPVDFENRPDFKKIVTIQFDTKNGKISNIKEY